MLSIVGDGDLCLVWHVGQKNPVEYLDVPKVTEVQADGHELEYIYENFTDLPHLSNGRVVRWFGDHARFIAGNID